MRVFLDTAPLIYLIENRDGRSDTVENQLDQWISTGTHLTTSTLTLLELLVVPKKNNDNRLVQKYRTLLKNLMSEPLIRMSDSIAELAAEIRGAYRFRTPDSIQLASAVYTGCDIFYTNDKRLMKYTEIQFILIENSLQS